LHKVESLTILGYSNQSIRYDQDWQTVADKLTNLEVVDVYFDAYRRTFNDYEKQEYTPEFSRRDSASYQTEFRAGQHDDDFSYAAEKLGLCKLATALKDNGNEVCKVFLRVDVTWTFWHKHRKCAYANDSVKFVVKSDSVEGVERS